MPMCFVSIDEFRVFGGTHENGDGSVLVVRAWTLLCLKVLIKRARTFGVYTM
jgi:hypothetical protein